MGVRIESRYLLIIESVCIHLGLFTGSASQLILGNMYIFFFSINEIKSQISISCLALTAMTSLEGPL